MNKSKKNNRGITLIALVVTIIVLIILAGISINLVLGENGIIQKAKEAKEATEQAQLNEEKALNELMDQWDDLVGGNVRKPGESGYKGGNYDDPYVPVGFTHTEGTWNSGYTIKDGLGNEFVWVPCVTDASKIKTGDNVELFKKTTEGKYNQLSLGLAPTDTNVTDSEPTEAIRTSVGIYGGFYIAKYEAGVPVDEDGNEIAPTLANASQKARSVSGATVWTDISRTNALIAAENMINNSVAGVNSGLITGECWDTTLQWMVNTSDNASTNVGYDVDSTGNGWYENSEKTTAGKYAINNIYDMAGNVWEWTAENCIDTGNNYLVFRGGHYGYNGLDFPVADRRLGSGETHSDIGFRVVLYKTELSYDNPYVPVGFTHKEGTWNSGYTIKDKLGNEFVWVPCVTDQNKVKEGDTVVTFGKILPNITDTTDPYYMYNRANETITGDENPANDIRISVGKYGGFYIAKYEAGVPLDNQGNEIATTSATISQKARSVSGATVWTNISRTNAITVAENMIDTSFGVKSGLISGECWDTALQWMVNTSENASNEPNTGYDIDSTGKGYYEQYSKTTTGQYPINNIYDMAGNVLEWTTENSIHNDENYAILRGGYYFFSGSAIPAAERGRNANSPNNDIGFRVVLYK